MFGQQASCSGTILLGQNCVRRRRYSARAECSGTILLGQSALAQFCSECSDTILLRQKVFGLREFCSGGRCSSEAFCSGRVLGHHSAWAEVVGLRNALGDVKDQAEDKADLKPWYTADEKSSKISTEDLLGLIREYPLPEGWYARLPGLQEPANYGMKSETEIYEEQVKSGYRLPLHPFALRLFEHYHMAPGKLFPNGQRKLVGLIYLVQTSGYKPDAIDFMRIVERVPIDEDPIFRPRWTLRCDDIRMPDSQISEQHLVHGVLPLDKEVFQNQTHETFDCSFAQAIHTKRDAIREAKEASHRAEELSKQEADHLAQIETLERRLERAKRKATEEVKKARDQGIRDFLDGNAREEWLKK
ncbi:hypothetical protein RJ639_020817 [Escallonia herrerae]|uniref:Transposase (putative) gypsy type domain-containing protein n=1 Tax=Escallonia herrerae TaxID=1293975 RepID=A0AA89AGH5_9ASTE|nr:hypothetical protein RJ639_020817 [Escallonia herrerae]